jgi:hypothetical protein
MSVFDASTLDKRPEWEDLFPLRLQGRQAVEFTLPPGDGQLFRIR